MCPETVEQFKWTFANLSCFYDMYIINWYLEKNKQTNIKYNVYLLFLSFLYLSKDIKNCFWRVCVCITTSLWFNMGIKEKSSDAISVAYRKKSTWSHPYSSHPAFWAFPLHVNTQTLRVPLFVNKLTFRVLRLGYPS